MNESDKEGMEELVPGRSKPPPWGLAPAKLCSPALYCYSHHSLQQQPPDSSWDEPRGFCISFSLCLEHLLGFSCLPSNPEPGPMPLFNTIITTLPRTSPLLPLSPVATFAIVH